jgi:hypothetical protein
VGVKNERYFASELAKKMGFEPATHQGFEQATTSNKKYDIPTNETRRNDFVKKIFINA